MIAVTRKKSPLGIAEASAVIAAKPGRRHGGLDIPRRFPYGKMETSLVPSLVPETNLGLRNFCGVGKVLILQGCARSSVG